MILSVGGEPLGKWNTEEKLRIEQRRRTFAEFEGSSSSNLKGHTRRGKIISSTGWLAIGSRTCTAVACVRIEIRLIVLQVLVNSNGVSEQRRELDATDSIKLIV